MNAGQESFNQIGDSVASLSSDVQLEKTNTVKDVIDKKIASFEDYLDSKVINIYQRSWNKLELKLKLKKLNEYYLVPLDTSESSESLSDEPVVKKKRKKGLEARGNFDQETVKNMLLGSDKKRVKVDYDVDKCIITSILIS